MNFKELIYKLFYWKLRSISKFENIHKGKDCIIFGDGASLKWFDLGAFPNLIAITVGYIPFHNDFKLLKCKYCFLVEPYWFFPFVKTTQPPFDHIPNKIQAKYRGIIRANPDKEFIVNFSNFPVLRGVNISHIFHNLPNSKFIDELYRLGIHPFHGSFRASVSLAIYMGFKTIYLTGFDYTHTPSRSHHWYEKGKGLLLDIENYERAFISVALKYINIITITIDGSSTKLNSITYEEFCGHKPSYNENVDLIEHEYLEALKTWKNYNL